MRLLWHRRPDQYYWVTSQLGARHVDGACRGLFVALTATLGALQIATLFTPVGPRGALAIVSTVVCATFYVVMSVMWARGRWPSRGQSKVFVLGMVAAATTTILLLRDPKAALLGTVMFAALGIYIAFFHGTGYLLVNFAAALLAVGVTTGKLATEDGVVAAVSAFVFVVVVNVIVAVVCWTALRLSGNDVLSRDTDVSTGLLSTEAFHRGVAELVGARAREGDRYLVFSAVVVDDLGLLAATDGHASRQQAQVAIAQGLRRNTRDSALVTHVHDDNVFVVAEVFSTAALMSYGERLQGALASTSPRMNISVGIVHRPLPGLAELPPEELAEQMIEAATQEARVAPSISFDREPDPRSQSRDR